MRKNMSNHTTNKAMQKPVMRLYFLIDKTIVYLQSLFLSFIAKPAKPYSFTHEIGRVFPFLTNLFFIGSLHLFK